MRHTARQSAALLTALILLSAHTGCVRRSEAGEPAGAAAGPGSAGEAAAAEGTGTQMVVGRKDGERFEQVILLEGMQETVRYEHVRNEDLGFELDYDYESFVRRSGPDRERFLPVWDDPADPASCLGISRSPEDADTLAASVRSALSQEYELLESAPVLERAGRCLLIEASGLKSSGALAEPVQAVYIIPAADGCLVAEVHYPLESAEGIGRRFSHMLNTLTVTDRNGAEELSDEQALAAVRRYCSERDPDLEEIVSAGEYPVYWDVSSGDGREIVVLFRSYTGAQVRYRIDRITGDTYVTEFVPGITPEEERTEERFSLWDYTD